MKKLFLFIGVLSMSFLSAQDLTDALRYSQQDILGTARYRGMSGAFGALGGDISALHINPAGSAVFANSSGSLTLSNASIDNEASYFNDLTTTSSSNFNLNQLGTVFVYDSYNEASLLNKISFGVTYDQTTDNVDSFTAFGRSTNSIDSYFLSEAQGVPLDLITRRSGESNSSLYNFLGNSEGYGTQQAFLGHESLLIEANDLNDLDNTSYFSNVASGSFDQEYYYESTGLNGKFSVNLGAQIHNDFFIGVNINSHFINYDRTTDFLEFNNNAGSYINEVVFSNTLSTIGAGFSAQIGMIAKVSEMFRLGISLESPTWYSIQEETTQAIETFSNADGEFLVAPNVINIFPEYELKTPAKATGSAAILFGQRGLISIDYSYKDYSTTEFSSFEGIDFSNQNEAITNNLQGASTIKIGGELRNGNWSFRTGGSYVESPYKNDQILSDTVGLSFGIGYNFGKARFDVAYDTSYQERSDQFFPNSGFSNAVAIDSYRDNLTFTLGLNL
ncbi:outer membrane protein transport protein [Aquimarina addita]|uniref:Outer membrane protein transport protein n=1 Tax=Aquimarina addita TaxID=870485 RepID=A0ABP7XD03_9FLAO